MLLAKTNIQNTNKKKTILNICVLFFVVIFCCSNLCAQDIITDDDIEKWLQEHAIDSAEIKEETKPKVIEKKQEKKSSKVRNSKKTIVESKASIIAPSAQTILLEIDSVAIAEQATKIAKYNSVFLERVFRYPYIAKSISLHNEDSLIQKLHENVDRQIRLENTALFVAHSDDLPSIDEFLNVNNSKDKNLRIDVESVKKGLGKISKPKTPYWKRGGDFSVQVSQNYISDNWYKGGESNLAAIVDAMVFLNYNNRKNIEWDNKAEYDLGINSAGSDSLRMFRVNKDLLRITTKLGVKAFDRFFYTLEGEFSTQFTNIYVPNTHERITAAFSPVRIYLSAGLDYKYKKIVSVFISPLSYKYVYVNDTTVKEGVKPNHSIARKLGVPEGHKSLHQLGGLLKIAFDHTFIDIIRLQSNLSFYTNYYGKTKGVEVDWEIKADFLINRYLSARLVLHPRFDNIVKLPDGEKPKLQLNETISVGFNYKL